MTRARWKIGWGVTAACNMRCRFCYSRLARAGATDVDLESAYRFVDANADVIDSINYGTGEAPLSPAWFRFIARVRTHHPSIRQAVTTNGTLWHATRGNGRSDRSWIGAIDEVDVSLDFADPARHNEARGCDCAYQWALATVGLCREEGIVPTIVVVGFEPTLAAANLAGLFDIAARYGAFVRLNVLRPTPGTGVPPPSYDELMAALSWLIEVVSLADPLFGSLFDPAGARPETTGDSSLRILPDGSITPSTYLFTREWVAGNVCDVPRLQTLRVSPEFGRLREAPVPRACAGCPAEHTCRGGALDRRVLHFHTVAARDPYCPLANGRPFPAPRPIRRHQSGTAVPTVHDGYLPTLIFAPA